MFRLRMQSKEVKEKSSELGKSKEAKKMLKLKGEKEKKTSKITNK